MALEKKKLTAKDINLILALVGVVIVVAVYLLVFSKFNTKNQELDAQITTQEAYYQQLKDYKDNLESYSVGTENSKKNIKSNLKRLPLGIKSEDFLVYILDSTDSVGAYVSTVNFGQEAEISTFSTVINNEMVDAVGYEVSASFAGTMTYSQLKAYLDYVYNESENLTFINTFSITANTETNDLEVTFDLSKYYITYDGSKYIAVPVPDVPLGTSNPFGA